MRIVLDTNILLISLPKISPYRPIFSGLVKRKFDLLISTEILLEYLEIIEQKTNVEIATNVIELITTQRNSHKIEPYFRWELLSLDKDDNKFVDCAIAGGADYLVTNDKHFNELLRIEFPKVEVVSADEFLKLLIKI